LTVIGAVVVFTRASVMAAVEFVIAAVLIPATAALLQVYVVPVVALVGA
jgi:hypothetical protein